MGLGLGAGEGLGLGAGVGPEGFSGPPAPKVTTAAPKSAERQTLLSGGISAQTGAKEAGGLCATDGRWRLSQNTSSQNGYGLPGLVSGRFWPEG